MEGPSTEDGQAMEPEAAPETSARHEADQDPEGRRHLQEVRVQEAVLEPDYAERSGETIEGHGSQGSHAGSLHLPEGVDPAAGGQPSQTFASDNLVGDEAAAAGQDRAASAERRVEDVGQVQRSLNFMTGLLTSLTERMSRVEQWQSATGSTAGGVASTARTPVTPSAGPLGWADVDRLNQQLTELHVRTEAGSGPGVVMNRPLASTTKIFQGTFSSDSSETAMKRAAEGQRGVPGALMGPLALTDQPFTLEGDPMQVDHVGDSFSAGLVMEQTVESVMQAQALVSEVRGRHELSSMPSLPRTTEPSSMPSLQGTTEPSSMPSLQGTTEPSSMPSLQRTTEPASMSLPLRPTEFQSTSSVPGALVSNMSSPPGIPEPYRMSSVAPTVQPLSAPPPQRTMDAALMSRPRTAAEPQSVSNGGPTGTLTTWPGSGCAGCGTMSFGMGGPRLPTEVLRDNEAGRPLQVEGGGFSGEFGRYVGTDHAQGSPVTVAELAAPMQELPVEVAVPGASAQGLVCVQGVWHPYTMVQGQMVVQFGSRGGPSLSAPAVVGSSGTPPPPPPVPPPPSTPKTGTTGGSSSTPGGTPVPPWSAESGAPYPPPAPPLATSVAASAVELGQSEEPSKLVTKLPVLASARGGDAAVIAGDWLAQLEPSMSSLSSSAAVWWRQLMDRVQGLYTTWLESAPVARLSLRQSVLSQRPAQDRHQRVEQRAAVLLLESLPEELRHEVVSVRAVTVEAMIFLVHCAYQPGGAGEKAHLLQFLTAPEVGSGLEGTLQLARKWVRLLRRGRELQLVLPDPSLLCRGLDRVISSTFSGNKHPSASFRIASFKLERQLDYKATLVDAEDYAYLVVGELEAALLAQPLPAPPKIARMEETKAGEEAGKGKGKAKQQRPCWSWQDGSGCKYGSRCMFAHAALGPGRCWECGSDSHLKPQCPILGQGGNASGGGGGQNSFSSSGKGSGGGAAAAASSSAATTSSSTGGGEDKPSKPPRRKKGGGKDKGGKHEAVRKAEEETAADGAPNATSSSTTVSQGGLCGEDRVLRGGDQGPEVVEIG